MWYDFHLFYPFVYFTFDFSHVFDEEKIAGDTDWQNGFMQVHHRVPQRQSMNLRVQFSAVLCRSGNELTVICSNPFVVGTRYCCPGARLFWVNPKTLRRQVIQVANQGWEPLLSTPPLSDSICFSPTNGNTRHKGSIHCETKKHEAIEWHVVECH